MDFEVDIDVINLLKAWNLADYIDIFTKNRITIQSLNMLTTEIVKEIIPIIGDRLIFIKNLENWKLLTSQQNELQPSDTIDTDIPLSEDGVDILSEHHRNSLLDTLNLIGSPMPSTSEMSRSFQQPTPTIKREKKSLLDLLKISAEGRAILKLHQADGLLDGNSRRKICNIIITDLLGEEPTKANNVSSDILLNYARQIKEIFTKENLSTYFIPYVNNKQFRVKRCAKGKLYDCLHNRKREYRDAEKKVNKMSVSEISHKKEILREDVTDDIVWLQASTEPWKTVEMKWKNTHAKRIEESKKMTISEYMGQYPSLKKPSGFQLLCLDFNIIYPDCSEKLYDNFSICKKKIIDMTLKKYNRTTDETLKYILDESTNESQDGSTDEEADNITAFLMLPLMVAQPMIKTKKNSWRPSKQESRESFITHVTRQMDLLEIIAKKKERYTKLGMTLQPTIYIVGDKINNIDQYFVLVDNTFYTVNNILQAVDVCFKIYQALNGKYPTECECVWQFIQKGFYKIKTPYDKEFISVNTLLSDLCLLE